MYYSSEDMISFTDCVLLKVESAYQKWKKQRSQEAFPYSKDIENRLIRTKKLQAQWDYQARNKEICQHSDSDESDLRAIGEWVLDIFETLGEKINRENYEEGMAHVPGCWRKTESQVRAYKKRLEGRA